MSQASPKIVIVDYGMGNIGSILNMIKKAGGEPWLTAEPDVVRAAQALVLPGVGAFDNAMSNLKSRDLIPALEHAVLTRRVPILGICLGMQLFANGSEEGQLPGLGWIGSTVRRFRFDGENSGLKVPHMGWNRLRLAKSHPIFKNLIDGEMRFYFVHSYHVVCDNEQDVLATATHGLDISAAIQRDNIVGAQFHPEKSHKFGLALFRNFVSQAGSAATDKPQQASDAAAAQNDGQDGTNVASPRAQTV